MTVELWNTERIRQELGATSIRSAMTIILRLGLTPVAREPGRSGMNLYPADEAGLKIAEYLARQGRRDPERSDVYSTETTRTTRPTPQPSHPSVQVND